MPPAATPFRTRSREAHWRGRAGFLPLFGPGHAPLERPDTFRTARSWGEAAEAVGWLLADGQCKRKPAEHGQGTTGIKSWVRSLPVRSTWQILETPPPIEKSTDWSMFGMAEAWDSDTKLVWNPYGTTARSVQALELKLGSLVLLLLVTLLCAFIPLWLFRRPGSALNTGSLGPQRKTLSLVSCFAGGIFLGTCLLDLLPSYLASLNEALEDLHVTLRFPLQEFILAMGFFIVLVLEQVVLAYKDPSGSLEETEALLSSASHQHPSLQEQARPEGSQWPPLARDRLAGERTHVHVDFNAHSAIRLVVLFLALSLHSVFEGLAVGLQEDGTQALEICLALLIHKGAIAFSLSLKLLQGRLRPRVVAICLVIFSAMSPFGIGLGVALTEVPMAALSRLSRSVLEGLATGTFVYITFLEILPHELGSSEQRILKVIVLLLGFALVTSVLFVKV